jgi:rhomboid protease GluP
MEMGYRLVLYILLANVAFMILSLARKGVKPYFGYLVQLGSLFALMAGFVGFGKSGPTAIAISGVFLALIVFAPILLQRQIEQRIVQQQFGEIEQLAWWKATLAWSDLNTHLLQIAQAMRLFESSHDDMTKALRELLGRGEPFDSMTRLFLAMIHFNLRQFEHIVDDLYSPEKAMNEYSFEELLYLVRGLLETSRIELAWDALLALEHKSSTDEADNHWGNLIVNRMLFFAFFGWVDEVQKLMETQKSLIKTLPPALPQFWLGVAHFYAGRFDEGNAIMEKSMTLLDDSMPDFWKTWMKKRIGDLNTGREAIQTKIIPQLQALSATRKTHLFETLNGNETLFAPKPLTETVTNSLTGVIFVAFLVFQYFGNSEDFLQLVTYGANCGFLVDQGEWFRLFTSLFIHVGWLHLLMNVIALRYFGPLLETACGPGLFLGIYFFGGLVASAASAWMRGGLSVGASGAVLGLLSCTIILELLHEPGIRRNAPPGNLATILFVLFINIVIGFVEKSVDNTAHIGGLGGGAVAGLFVFVLLKFDLLRRLSQVVFPVLLIILAAASTQQFRASLLRPSYPTTQVDAHEDARIPFRFGLPQGWTLEKPTGEIQRRISQMLVGPVGERIEISYGERDEPISEILQQYTEEQTRSFADSPELSLRSFMEPKRVEIGGREVYVMQWRFKVGDRPFVERDYLMPLPGEFFLLQCVLPTDQDAAYTPLIEGILTRLAPLPPVPSPAPADAP